MDNLTHGLTGAIMGQAGLKKKTGLGLIALILGANLPDIDVLSMIWLDGRETLGFRRGITHGPIGVALLPLGLAGLLWGFDKWQTARGTRPPARDPVRFGWLYLLGLIGAISHVLMDWLNVYGVRFLYPFDQSWYYGDTLFIIDVWLWALLIGCVWWSLRRERKGGDGRKPAWIGIGLGLAYIAANWGITAADTQLNGRYDEPYPARYISSPAPLLSWQRERIAQLPGGRWLSSTWDGTDFGYGYNNSELVQCEMPDLEEARKTNAELDAFLIWTRAPMAEGLRDGSIILRDARFYDPRARDRFSIPLPDIQCVELVPE
ncbi:MAG: metal-dependent hydrolase [Pseudomonadota bacterium]